MTRIFFPPTIEIENQQVYCYVNNFKKVVIAKIKGLKNRHCERVIFPQEKFVFMADENCELEIVQQTNIGLIKDTIVCSKLKTLEN